MSSSVPFSAQGRYSQMVRAYTAADVTIRSTIPQGPTFLSFLSAAQALQIPIMPITWQRARNPFGFGGTSSINQTPINAQVSLAFKCVRGNKKCQDGDAKLFERITNEITVLGQSSTRNHPNVVQLQGICWDVSEEKVWPALVFEKSDYGDLSTFYGSSSGRQLSTNQRLKICIDVGKAIFYMHSNSE
jgi:hypothetical protein